MMGAKEAGVKKRYKYLVLDKMRLPEHGDVMVRVKGPAVDQVADDDAWPVAVWGPRYVAEIYADELVGEENREIIRTILRDIYGGDPPMHKVRVRLSYRDREARLSITAPDPSIW